MCTWQAAPVPMRINVINVDQIMPVTSHTNQYAVACKPITFMPNLNFFSFSVVISTLRKKKKLVIFLSLRFFRKWLPIIIETLSLEVWRTIDFHWHQQHHNRQLATLHVETPVGISRKMTILGFFSKKETLWSDLPTRIDRNCSIAWSTSQ